MRSTRLLLAGSVTVFVGCAQASDPAPPPAPSPAPVVDTVVVVDTVEVETESPANAALEEQVARLRIELLEREVLVADLQQQLSATRLEVVRNLSRLQTQATRAEAASGLAEAEIALASLRRVEGGEGLQELARAEELFEQSSAEFDNENYGGALYLATEARTAVRDGQARLGDGSLLEGESLFAVPVPMRTTNRSNVRSGPGLNFDVVYTADASAALTGQSRTRQWVRVVDDRGRAGWIFHTLVTSR